VLILVPTLTTPKLEIISPSDGSHVSHLALVEGISAEIPESQEIWILVYPHDVTYYYPQNGPAVVEASGYWSSLVLIGPEQAIGREFDIIAVLASREAQEVFRASIPQGFPILPDGAVIYDHVTVMRK
jgi:hypothetical protein